MYDFPYLKETNHKKKISTINGPCAFRISKLHLKLLYAAHIPNNMMSLWVRPFKENIVQYVIV